MKNVSNGSISTNWVMKGICAMAVLASSAFGKNEASQENKATGRYEFRVGSVNEDITDITRLLLDSGADMDKEGPTALMVAESIGDPASSDDPDRLHIAAYDGDTNLYVEKEEEFVLQK